MYKTAIFFIIYYTIIHTGWRRFVEKVKVYSQTKLHHDNSIHGWIISTSDL